MKDILNRRVAGEALSENEAREIMLRIGQGEINPSQIAAFLSSYWFNPIQVDELKGFVAAMLDLAVTVDLSEFDAMDVCGTGGDGKDTFNISTTSSFIIVGAGQKIAKHGNHGVSSSVGSSTVLEFLGLKFNNDPKILKRKMETAGMCFLHAPLFHPAMRFAAPARKELATATVFNILGPLANPARPKAAAIGVANERMHLVMAQVLADRGVDGFVFRGDDGLDEITLATATSVLSIGSGEITSDRIDAKDFGLANAPISALVGGDARENARITNAIFAGEKGAPRDAVLLNAAAAIAAFDGQVGQSIHERISASLLKAADAVDSGAAAKLLTSWVTLSQELAKD
jgi:anthranilate phosphoribosyltransferase